MSIIIRLQNLPWNANAADIRQFFQNLTIPDGGVHIVGGENGDAFIAFGSDEDARQAMLMDGGNIKEAKVKLLLSSRTEMQKVIESARQQALTLQNLMQSMAAASSFGASPLSMLPNVLSGMSSVLPNLSSLQPVIAASVNASSSVTIPAPPTSADLKDIKSSSQTESKTSAASTTKNSGKSSSTTKTDGGKTRSRSISRSRSKSVSKSRSHSRSRSRSRSRDRRYRDRYRYGGSGGGKSRDSRRRRDRSRSKERSRSRDRYKKRSRSRERRNRDIENIYKSRGDKRRTHDKKDRSPMHDDKDRNGHRKNSDGKSKPVSVSELKPPPSQQQQQQQHQQHQHPKNESTSSKVSSVNDAKTSEPPSVDSDTVSSIVARILAKTKAGASESSLEKPSNPSGNVATKIKSEPTSDASKSWMSSVPLPPMISSWMASQTTSNTSSATTEAEKKVTASSEASSTNNENKSSSTGTPCPPVMPPYGMYSARFPFGAGFPAPPTMYPFMGYPTATAATGTGTPVPVAQPYVPTAGANQPTSMPMPPAAFFNPYQQAAAVQPTVNNESSNQSLKTAHSRDYSNERRGPPSHKMPRLDNNDETKTERSNYDDGNNYDHFKRPTSSTNSSRSSNYPYYDDGGDSKSRTYHNNDNYNGDRRNNRFSSYDNNSYSYRPNRNDAYEDNTSSNRRTYHRRNFFDSDETKTNDEFDRKPSYNSTSASAYPGSVCALVENLPSDVVIDDIKTFFSPLRMYESSIKLQMGNKDDSFRKAFVKFLNFNDKLQALKYSGKFLRSNRVSVSDMDPAKWESAEDRVVALTDQQHLKISFIPKRAQKQDLLDAFTYPADDLILMKDGKKDALVAYVKFTDSATVKSILADKNKILVCDSRVKLEPVSEEDFLVARADYQTCDDNLDVDNGQNEETSDKVSSNEFNKPSETDERLEPQTASESKSNCILMKNLPYPVTDLDIVNFFSDLHIIPSQIHIMFDTNYKQTGDSFCEFATAEQAEEAVEKKNNGKMKYKAVTLKIVPKEEVLKVITNQLPEEEEEPSSPPANNLPPPNPKPYAPRFPAPAYGGPAPRFYSPRGPSPHARPPGPPGPDNFGKPGCVVSLENVAFKAEVEDILELFSEFDVQREHVIRRFNDKGWATGDARVCLSSPYEAQKAARYLDGQMILGRRVFVRLV